MLPPPLLALQRSHPALPPPLYCAAAAAASARSTMRFIIVDVSRSLLCPAKAKEEGKRQFLRIWKNNRGSVEWSCQSAAIGGGCSSANHELRVGLGRWGSRCAPDEPCRRSQFFDINSNFPPCPRKFWSVNPDQRRSPCACVNSTALCAGTIGCACLPRQHPPSRGIRSLPYCRHLDRSKFQNSCMLSSPGTVCTAPPPDRALGMGTCCLVDDV